MRHHTIKITAERWKDVALRERIRTQARAHADRNPGMIVWVKKENEYRKHFYEVVWQFCNHSGTPQGWE